MENTEREQIGFVIDGKEYCMVCAENAEESGELATDTGSSTLPVFEGEAFTCSRCGEVHNG